MVFLEQYGLAYNPDLLVVYLGRNDTTNPLGPTTLREGWERRRRGEPGRVECAQGLLRRSGLYNGMTALIAAPERRWYSPEGWVPINPLPDFEANLRDIIEAATARGGRVALVAEFSGEHFFEGIETDRERAIREAMRRVAEQTGVAYLDAWEFFHADTDPRRFLRPGDPVHINEAGHARLAAWLAESLTRAKLISPKP